MAIAGLCGTLLGTLAAGFYYYQYEDLRSRIAHVTRHLDIGIDYENFTRVWHNRTEAFSGETLLNVTMRIANVNLTTTAYGTEINTINGVTKQGSHGWFYWIWNSTSNTWGYVWTGADKYIIIDNEIFMWHYVDWNDFKAPP